MPFNDAKLAVWLFLCSLPALADVSESLGTNLDKVTVTAPSSGSTHALTSTRSTVNYNREAIQSSESQTLEEVLAAEPGIVAETTEGGMVSGLNIRGYRLDATNIRLNQHPDNLYLYRRDLSTVESIQVIKGMSSVLYGMGTPGGSLAYNTKKPQQEAYSEAQLSIGSYNLKRLTADTTGALANQLSYRLIYTEQDSDTFIDNVADDRRVALGSIQWDYGDDSSLLLELEYTRLTNPYTFGIVRMNEEILYDISYVDPRNQSERTYQRSSLYWRQAINSNWSLDALVSYVTADRDDLMMGFYYKIDETTLAGYWADVQNEVSQFNSRLAVTGKFTTAGIEHELTFGTDYNQLTNAQQRLVSSAFTLDAYNPKFDTPEPRDQASERPRKSTDTDKSLFIADSLSPVDDVVLNAGVRYTEFRTVNRLTNDVRTDESALSTELGARWNISNNLSTWASSSRSSEPNYGTDINGDYFDPKEATQQEVGVSAVSSNVQWQAVVYRLEQTNLLTPDTADKDALVATGTRRTQGLELGALLPFTLQWDAELSYTHMQNEIIDDFFGLKGNRAANVPYYTAAATLNWTASNNRLNGLTGYLTLVRIGERFADARNTFRLQPYHRINAGLTHQQNSLTWRLAIANLLDKRYVAGATAEDDIYQGSRRSLVSSVAVSW